MYTANASQQANVLTWQEFWEEIQITDHKFSCFTEVLVSFMLYLTGILKQILIYSSYIFLVVTASMGLLTWANLTGIRKNL